MPTAYGLPRRDAGQHETSVGLGDDAARRRSASWTAGSVARSANTSSLVSGFEPGRVTAEKLRISRAAVANSNRLGKAARE